MIKSKYYESDVKFFKGNNVVGENINDYNNKFAVI